MRHHDNRSTPARLTASATAKLPRLFLVIVGLVYIFAGLYFRDPWKTDDIVGLATMMSALNEPGLAIWLPQVGNLAHAQDGPLVMWVGALFITVFSPFFELFTTPLDAIIISSRIPNFLWFGLLAGSVWYATYLLGRRPEPQPLPLPFGGEPSVKDYGRMIADAAVLLILATAGIMWRMHETSEVPAIIAFQALSFYSVVRMQDRPMSGALSLGIALAGAFLSRGLIGAGPILIAVACSFIPRFGIHHRLRWLLVALALAIALSSVWLLPAIHFGPYWIDHWWAWHIDSFTWPKHSEIFNFVRDLPWFLWPTWPFAILAIWQWRSWLNAPHIWLPLMFAMWPLILMLFLADPFEPEYSLMAMPCAILAAFSLPTLRRGAVNALDWFAVMCFSLTSATVWLGWIALQMGWPRQIANNIARKTQGYEAFISWPAVSIALLGTLAWFYLVKWRLQHRPAALWRGTVLSAGGIITTWLLLVTLWMPALDYVRSYRKVSAELQQAIEATGKNKACIGTSGIGLGQKAAFYVFNSIKFSHNASCPLMLVQTSPQALSEGSNPLPGHQFKKLWEGRRTAERKENFLLLQVLSR